MTTPDPQAAELVERLRLHVTWRDSHGELNDAPNDAADLIERLTPTPEPSLREALEECADKLWVIHFGLADAAERKAAERACEMATAALSASPAEPEVSEAMIEAGDKVLGEYWAIPCAARIGAVRRIYTAMRSAVQRGEK